MFSYSTLHVIVIASNVEPGGSMVRSETKTYTPHRFGDFVIFGFLLGRVGGNVIGLSGHGVHAMHRLLLLFCYQVLDHS